MKSLDDLNNVTVSYVELMEVNQRMVEIHKDHGPDGDAIFFIVAQKFKDDANKAMAISFRMHALAKLVAEGVPAWALPKEADGAIPISECLFAAAAVAPLIEIDSKPAFDRNSFLNKALEFSEIEGEA